MEDDVGLVDQFGDVGGAEERIDHEAELRVCPESGHIVRRARREIVQGDDLVAFAEQRLGEMGADEDCAPRDEVAHCV